MHPAKTRQFTSPAPARTGRPRRPRPRRPPLPALLLRLLAVLLGAALLTGCGAGPGDGTGTAGTASGSPPAWAEGMEIINPGDLPPEGRRTLELIESGGPFPYDKDGTTFMNRERRLPEQSRRGYYREYTVDTPGLSHRGPRRIVTGSGGEIYYTEDHYESFKAVVDDE